MQFAAFFQQGNCVGFMPSSASAPKHEPAIHSPTSQSSLGLSLEDAAPSQCGSIDSTDVFIKGHPIGCMLSTRAIWQEGIWQCSSCKTAADAALLRNGDRIHLRGLAYTGGLSLADYAEVVMMS